jgi:protein-S-isoprenylcysteine O-methyltransferase Ste14
LLVKAVGFIGIILSFMLVFWVMRENTFLSRIVEIQKEKGHRVITTGPYQYVRHPMYFGVIVLFFSIPVALGSLLGLIPSGALTLLILIRTVLEDKTLREELEGYNSYTEKVRYKIIPGIW